MPDTSVKFFTSAMSGASTITGNIIGGGLLDMLDDCLIDGFGSVALDSLTVASEVAVATISTGHGFSMHGETGPVIAISGASVSELNAEWRVTGVTDANTFSFATPGVADISVGGNPSAKRAPAGWSKLFSGTDKAVYERQAIDATAMVLRIDDSVQARSADIEMFESMSDIDTGSGGSSAADDVYISHYSGGTREWWLVADGHCVYFGICSYNTYWANTTFFGDIVTFLNPDSYHAVLIGNSNTAYTGNAMRYLAAVNGHVIARGYPQSGAAITCQKDCWNYTTQLGRAGFVYPHPVGNGLICKPVQVIEMGATRALRGAMPGMFNPLIYNGTDIDHYTYFDDVSGIAGKTLAYVRNDGGSTPGGLLLDITGPWR